MVRQMDRVVHRWHLQRTHISRCLGANLAHTSPSALTTHALPVGGEIERDEQQEVRGEDANSGESGKLFAGACARGGEIGEVGR